MDPVVSCNPYTSLYRQLSYPKRSGFPSNSFKCRRKTISKLQTPVSVTGPNDNFSPPSIPAHKVIVHDRKQGVVHEFLVPEDQYILHTIESQNITLPFICRQV
ncbi:hypothetical protein CRYUN_Cryun35bG0087300 [Craigia yunnanensis]